jgi:hypothetical protein
MKREETVDLVHIQWLAKIGRSRGILGLGAFRQRAHCKTYDDRPASLEKIAPGD